MTEPLLPLSTERLILRTHRDDDAEPLLAAYGDPEVARYLLEDPWTPEVAQKKVAERIPRDGIDGDSTALAVVIEREGTVLGDVALWVTDHTGRCAEIGWVMRADAHGHGYATEAVRAVIDLAFGAYGLHRVAAQLDPRNAASARLCERVGMTREAHLRQNWFSKGEWTDTWIYGALAEEWALSR